MGEPRAIKVTVENASVKFTDLGDQVRSMNQAEIIAEHIIRGFIEDPA